MRINIYFSSYLSEFLEREMFHTKVVEKIKIRHLCSITLFSENRGVYARI